MRFILLNLFLFLSSSGLDALLLPLFHIKEWTTPYFYYLFCFNLPLSIVVSYWLLKRVMAYLKP